MWHHKVTPGGRAEISATKARQSEDKELQEIDRRIAEEAVPDDGGDPMMDALLNWEPAEDIPHVRGDMAKPRYSINHTIPATARRKPFKGCNQTRIVVNRGVGKGGLWVKTPHWVSGEKF